MIFLVLSTIISGTFSFALRKHDDMKPEVYSVPGITVTSMPEPHGSGTRTDVWRRNVSADRHTDKDRHTSQYAASLAGAGY